GFSADGPNGARGILRLDPDGRLTLVSSLTDMGQGIGAGALAALSRILGVSAEEVRFEAGDTRPGADSGPTSASRGTQVVLSLVRAGVGRMKEKL
ncbi:xanthine dehydrogenase, partial [Escherichia coli]|nr:xanthine dehydrogenase [Escherichia coli]